MCVEWQASGHDITYLHYYITIWQTMPKAVLTFINRAIKDGAVIYVQVRNFFYVSDKTNVNMVKI